MKMYYINFDGRKKESKGRFQNIQKTITAETLDKAIDKIKANYTIEGINSTTELNKVSILM